MYDFERKAGGVDHISASTTMEIRWPVWPPRIKMAFEYVVAVK